MRGEDFAGPDQQEPPLDEPVTVEPEAEPVVPVVTPIVDAETVILSSRLCPRLLPLM